jgi:transcriptional regulator with XRE-family HTH domain
MQALLDYLKNSGLTQTELAKKLGVHQGQLNHWLRARRAPNAENLKLISQRTGISLERLLRDL